MRWVLFTLVGLLFAGPATAAPVPKALKKPPPEPTRVPIATALERVERHTRMLFMAKFLPADLELDWPWPSGENPPSEEVFALLNVQLEPHGYALVRKTQSFTIRAIAK